MGAFTGPFVTVAWVVQRRGYTLIEVGVTLLFLTLLGSLAVVTYNAVISSVGSGTSPAVLTMVQVEGRRLLANNSFQGFPTTLADDVVLRDISITDAASDSPDIVSVFIESPTVAVYAAGSDLGCLVLVDRLGGAPTWVKDFDTPVCAASLVAPVVVDLEGGTPSVPLEVALS